MRYRTPCVAALALAAALLQPTPVAAQYTYQIFPAPANSYITAITDNLSVAGNITGSNSSFVRSPTAAQFYYFTYPGSTSTTFLGYDNAGLVLGTANVPTQYGSRGLYFTLYNSQFTEISIYGVGAVGPNNSYQIAGVVSGGSTGYIQTIGGTTTTYTLPQYAYDVTALNDYGWTVGPTSSFGVGYIRSSDGTVAYWSIPGSEGTKVAGFNNPGQIVGNYFYGQGPLYTGFVRNLNGAITSINVPGAQDTYVGAINNNGVIAGTGIMPDGTWLGFFAYPAGYTGTRSNAIRAGTPAPPFGPLTPKGPFTLKAGTGSTKVTAARLNKDR